MALFTVAASTVPYQGTNEALMKDGLYLPKRRFLRRPGGLRTWSRKLALTCRRGRVCRFGHHH